MSLRFYIIPTIFLGSISLKSIGQTSLIVAEHRIDTSKVGNFTYLVSYNFENGKLFSKDTLFGAETVRKGIPGSYVRYDLGTNFIYKNRFLISGIGNVVDLFDRSLLYEELDEDFCEVTGDSIIFTRNDEITGIGKIIYSTKKKKYLLEKDKNFIPLKGQVSPDFNKALQVENSYNHFKIVLHFKNGTKEIIVDDSVNVPSARKWQPTVLNASVPILWFDNDNFIYAHFNRKKITWDSVHSSVLFYKMNIKDKKKIFIGEADSVIQIRNSPFYFRDKLYFDKSGRLIFLCGIDLYQVNTTQKKSSAYNFFDLGNNFYVSTKINKDTGYTLKYGNDTIGTFWCTNEETIDSYIAIAFGDIGSNLAYPKGIKVWSNITKQWTTIEVPWLTKIIGWMNRE